MATGVACPNPILQFFNNAGQFNNNGSILTQVGGVNTATYQDAGLTAPLPNPIPLNSRGEVSNASGLSCQLFLTPNTVYVFTMLDANGNQLNQASYVDGIQLTTPTSIGALLWPRNAAEIAAGVTPTNLVVPSADILGYVSLDRYGADPTGVIDATAIIQAALNVGGVGSTVWIPPGTYRINGTLNKFAGQIIKGASWATTPLTYVLAAGSTVLKQYSVADIPLIQQAGVSDAAQVERGGLEDIALINNVPGSAVGTAYYTNYARQQKLDNVYVSSFSKGFVFDNVCWLMQVNHCRIMDFTKSAVVQNSASEDNLYTNCQFSGYWPAAVAVSLNNESANTTFINCYFQGCNYGVVLSQGDTNGNGTGVPFPMHASFFGCLMEDIIQAGFVLVASQLTPAGGNAYHPGLTLKHLRAFNSGNFFNTINVTGASGTGTVATLNWTQIITAAQVPPVGSQITVSGMNPAGYNGAYIVTASTLTSVSFANATTGFTSGGTFVYGAQANNNQSLIYAQHASQIDVQDVYANGFSYGATLMGQAYSGVAGFQYGYFYTVGTSPVGPVFWSQDNNAVYGIARFLGVTGAVTKIPGDRPLTRLTSAALSYTATNNTIIPFNGVVSDFPGWYSNANTGWIPLRSQQVRFRAQILTASAPTGQYALRLYKNGVAIGLLYSSTVSTAGQPLLMHGEFYDVPNGTTDYYNIVVNSSASFTLDTAITNTWAVAEAAGT
jgi:Pectate lyase superfamily protein